MQLARVKSLTSVEPRTTRFQCALPLPGRLAVRPIPPDREAPASQKWTHSRCASEHHPALDRTIAHVPVHIPAGREARGLTQMYCVDGEVSLVVRWASSSAFICEICGKPELSSANAEPSSCPAAWRGVAAVRKPRRTAILRLDPREKDPL
jgi:hypothetical protein